MRFGHLRGVMFTVALVSSMANVQSASADAFGHVMPKEILARDLSTGEPYYAPPVPWGCYAKDGHFDHFFPKHCGICGLLAGKGLGHCGGHGLLGHGEKGCGKSGCGHCGKGLFQHGASGCSEPSCGLFSGMGHGRRIKDCGLCAGKGCGLCQSTGVGAPIHAYSSEQSAPGKVVVTPQSHGPIPSPQTCTEPGCKLGKGHRHGGSSMMGDPCGGCGGKGCGLCGGLGRLFHHGNGGDSCRNCGGKGCGLCGGLGHLKGKLFGLLHPHAGDIKYFVGPGGPVPLTPGYVPYVVPTRSPRDFLAFPPYTPDGF